MKILIKNETIIDGTRQKRHSGGLVIENEVIAMVGDVGAGFTDIGNTLKRGNTVSARDKMVK